LLFKNEFFILKAHGDIDRPKSLILTANDYRDLTHSKPAFSAFFSAILLTKAILFVGYSMNDPDFRLLLDRHLTLFEGYVPERYVLMPRVSEIESTILMQTGKLRVLPYSKHEEVPAFLKALRDGYSEYKLLKQRGRYHFRKVGQQSQGESFKSKKRFFSQGNQLDRKSRCFEQMVAKRT
jgi:hypothetical protein